MDKSTTINSTLRDFIKPVFRHKLAIVIAFLIIVPFVFIGLAFQTPVYEARVLIHIKGISQIAAPTYIGVGSFRIHLTQMAIVKSNPVVKRAVQALKLEKRPLDYEKKFCHPLKRYIIDYQVAKQKDRLNKLPDKEKEEFLLWLAMITLKDNLETVLQPNTDIFEIIVRDYEPNSAVEIANVVSRSYTIYDLQQQLNELTLKYGDLHPTIQQLQDNIHKMTLNLTGKEISDMDAMGTASVKIIEQASSEYRPIGRPKLLILIVAILVSGVVGIALAYVLDVVNQTIKSPNDVVQYLGIPCIGTIPKKRLADRFFSHSNFQETYDEFMNDLSEQMYIFMKVQNLKTLLFVSVSSQDNNDPVTSNLGCYLSQYMDLNTLIIDANLVKHSIHQLFRLDKIPGLEGKLEKDKLSKMDDMPGFANILDGNAPNADIKEIVNSIDEKLHVLQTGSISQNTTPVVNESNVKTIIRKLEADYNAIIIDCTLLKKITDVSILMKNIDGVVLLISEAKDYIQTARKMMTTLKQNKAKIIGGILHNRTFPIPTWLYKRI